MQEELTEVLNFEKRLLNDGNALKAVEFLEKIITAKNCPTESFILFAGETSF